MKLSTPILVNQNLSSETDIAILNFINSFKDKEFNYSQKELANILYCSEATISRFVKKNNFDSYKKMIIYINYKIQKNFLIFNNLSQNLIENDFKNLYKIQAYALESSITKENVLKITQAAKMIAKADKIVVFGLGTSGKIAGEFSANLWKIGKNAIYNSDYHVMFPNIAHLKSKDLIIFLTNNFQNYEAFFILKKAKELNIKTLVITSNEEEILKECIDLKITYSKIHDESKVIPIASKISQFIIIDYIFEHLMSLNLEYKTNLKKSQEILQEWNKWISKSKF